MRATISISARVRPMSSRSRFDKDDSELRVIRASFQETPAWIVACTMPEIRAATVVGPNDARFVSNVVMVAVLLCVGRDHPVLMIGI